MSVVLITGGSRGIGRAMVELFSHRGWQVAFTYLNSEQAAKAVAEEFGALAIRADSGVSADVRAAVNRTVSELGGVDCLINNAAISSFSLFTDITEEDWDRTLRVNLTGAFLYTQCVIPEMLNKKQGSIINITSMWGQVGSSCEVHYSAAKAGLIGMTKALAKELGPSGITVNAIAPGVIATDMNSELSKEDLASLCDETPLMRLGQPHEVAAAAYYLASPEAAFITGAVLNVNGGFVV